MVLKHLTNAFIDGRKLTEQTQEFQEKQIIVNDVPEIIISDNLGDQLNKITSYSKIEAAACIVGMATHPIEFGRFLYAHRELLFKN